MDQNGWSEMDIFVMFRFTALQIVRFTKMSNRQKRKKKLSAVLDGRTVDVTTLPWQLISSVLCDDLLLIDFSSSEVEVCGGQAAVATMRLLVANQHSTLRLIGVLLAAMRYICIWQEI